MKKILVTLLAAICLLMASCGNKAVLDDCGCYVSITDAKKAAQASDKNIILAITNEGGDLISSEFVEKVMKSSDFKDAIEGRYVVWHFDASQSAFEKTVAKEDATKAEKKAAAAAEQLMNESIHYAININGGAYSPQFFVLSKDAYPIVELYYEDNEDEISPADFIEIINQYAKEIDMFNSMIDATKTGTKEEKIMAIDNVYTTTQEVYRVSMTPLWQAAVKMDPKNKSGLVGKFIYSIAEAEASEYYLNGEVGKAIATLIKTAEKKNIEPENVQSCYYLAAYLLSSSGSTEIELIADYLQKSYDAAPDTEIAPSILGTALYYKNYDPSTEIDANPEDLGIDFNELLDAESEEITIE